MRALRRWILGLAAGVGVFLVLAYPAVWGELYARRELYRAFEFVGIMDPEGALGGQILGFNFQREPAWAHGVIQFAGASLAFAPGVLAAVLLAQRFGRGERATLCGACGGVLRVREGRCERCGSGLEGSPHTVRDGGARWWIARRRAAAVVGFGAAYTLFARTCGWTVRACVEEVGFAMGHSIYGIPPFSGDDPESAMLNVVWHYSVPVVSAAVGLASAFGMYAVCAGPLGRSRAFGYRGRTRCGGCGYALAGLRDLRCPECGRGV